MAPADDIEKIVNDGARQRGNDANATRKERQSAFARSVEKSLLLQFLLQLLKCELQRPDAHWFERLSDELKLTTLSVDRDTAARQNVQSGFGAKAEKSRLPPEEDDGKLALLILQCEVKVSGGGAAQIGDFALDPAVGIGSLDMATYLGKKGTDRPDTARLWLSLRREEKSQLLYRTVTGLVVI